MPPAKWYDWYTYQAVTDKGGVSISVDTPIDYVPVSAVFVITDLQYRKGTNFRRGVVFVDYFSQNHEINACGL